MGYYMVNPHSMTVSNGGGSYLLNQSHSEYSLRGVPAFFPAAPVSLDLVLGLASGEDDLQLNCYWSHCGLDALCTP